MQSLQTLCAPPQGPGVMGGGYPIMVRHLESWCSLNVVRKYSEARTGWVPLAASQALAPCTKERLGVESFQSKNSRLGSNLSSMGIAAGLFTNTLADT